MLAKCLKIVFFITAITIVLVGLFALYGFQIKTEGTLYLENAWGNSVITREDDTQIIHVRGSTFNSMAYGQGFAHAQTRLWQMEKSRRIAQGQLSELFGKETLKVDKYMVQLGIRKMSERAFELMKTEEKDLLQAYADGINDFVQGVDLLSSSSTARLLPLEFYVFKI